MLVYRLTQTRYVDDMIGEGARLFGGRWNLPMVPCLYTSESRALALAEYSVNVNVYEIPRTLSFITYEINKQDVTTLHISDLPGNWRSDIIPKQTQEFGSNLLVKLKRSIIRVPSVVIPDEFNYLINTSYLKGLKVIEIKDFVYDVRLKLK